VLLGSHLLDYKGGDGFTTAPKDNIWFVVGGHPLLKDQEGASPLTMPLDKRRFHLLLQEIVMISFLTMAWYRQQNQLKTGLLTEFPL
jgi:hypothetical protein